MICGVVLVKSVKIVFTLKQFCFSFLDETAVKKCLSQIKGKIVTTFWYIGQGLSYVQIALGIHRFVKITLRCVTKWTFTF